MFLGSFHKYIKRIFYDQTFPQINMITYMTVLVCGIKHNLKKKYSGVFSTTAKVFRLNFFLKVIKQKDSSHQQISNFK